MLPAARSDVNGGRFLLLQGKYAIYRERWYSVMRRTLALLAALLLAIPAVCLSGGEAGVEESSCIDSN